ncbi:MAG: hypothetical protein Q8M24_22730 [Pseudolabrys sp.]|nr:hypothetical protein [Pseudolabrys sp.]
MNTTVKTPAEALELLPEPMRESAVAYIMEQAEKYRVLKQMIDEGIADVEAGNVKEWNFEEFLREARLTE